MEQIIDLEFKLWHANVFPAKLIFELDKFVLELDAHFSLDVEVVLVFLLCLFEFLSLVLEHPLDFTHVVIVVGKVV